MRPRFVLVSALALGFVVMQSDRAHADSPGPNVASLPVIGIASEDALEQASALSQALRSGVRASQGWSLPEREYSLEVLSLTLGCSEIPDPPCQLRIANEIGADRYVWGTLARAPGTRDVIVDLHLFERDVPGGSLQLRYNDNLVEPGDEALKKLAAQALQKLTGGAPKGTLQLKSASANGEIHIGGQIVGSLQDGGANLRLAPGEHQVEVRGEAGVEAGTVVIRPNETVQLVLAPLYPASGEMVVAPVEVRRDLRKPLGWLSVGVGGGLVLGGVYSAVKVGNIESDAGYQAYRRGFSSGQDVCDAARDGRRSSADGAATPREVNEMCDRASTFTTLQYVFFGTGVAAIGAGAYLLISSMLTDESPQRGNSSSSGGVAVVPTFGPGVGAVDLHLTF